ncbi:MAG: DUF4830 domain-containing protein [Clostridia bacterium]
MIVMTTRLSKKKIIAGILGVAVAVCAVVMLNTDNTVELRTDGAARIEVESIRSAADCAAFLGRLGWQVGDEPLEFMELQIPQEFDEVYRKYNDIQKKQGLDLEKYAGKRAMRYSFAVSNYPTGGEGVIANVITYKEKLIAGDVCSPKLQGFMHGLNMPAGK